MMKKMLVISMLVNALLLSKAWAIEEMWANDQTAQEAREQQIYGSQLMTEQERAEYRAKVHAAPSEEERAQIRSEHHALMQQRAKAKGITLSDMPQHGMENEKNMHDNHKMDD